ncbi:unnamed protein product [Ectocarpus sp. CCAP 1310/34]|nr:unnamed protein product [Ectocarpus sp. CCAP 1310/34]
MDPEQIRGRCRWAEAEGDPATMYTTLIHGVGRGQDDVQCEVASTKEQIDIQVILTDADLAMTAAIASCWPGTLHLHCLWHVFKNVFKNCSSSFATNDDKTDMMRCFRNEAFAATPEVFGTQVARLEQLVAGKKCEGYIADLIKNKTKWAFCCRSTVLTLGMVATQRSPKVDEAQAYDAELVSSGRVEENGDPLPLHEHDLAKIRSLRLKLNILQVAPPNTDLEGDQIAGEAAVDNTMWARTSLSAFLDLIEDIPIELFVAVRYKRAANRPSHLVVFGLHNFHLCSCLQLLRRGLPCRHYFAVLVNLIGRTGESDEMAFTHTFNGACVHNRWRRREVVNDSPWSISSVLSSSGHSVGWDGNDEGRDEKYWGPTCDEAVDGIHPAGPGRAAQDRSASDKRRVYAHLMATSKELVGDIMRSVPLHQALSVQDKVGEYLRYLLNSSAGSTGVQNPGEAPKKGWPKKDGRRQPLQHRSGAKEEPGKPEGQQGKSRQT